MARPTCLTGPSGARPWTAAASRLFTWKRSPARIYVKVFMGSSTCHCGPRSAGSYPISEAWTQASGLWGLQSFVKSYELKTQWCPRGLGFCAFHRLSLGSPKSSWHEGSWIGASRVNGGPVGSVPPLMAGSNQSHWDSSGFRLWGHVAASSQGELS